MAIERIREGFKNSSPIDKWTWWTKSTHAKTSESFYWPQTPPIHPLFTFFSNILFLGGPAVPHPPTEWKNLLIYDEEFFNPSLRKGLPCFIEVVARVAGADDTSEVCGALLLTQSELLTAGVLTLSYTPSNSNRMRLVKCL